MTRSRAGQTTILMTSITLNVVLIGIIFWLGVHNGRIQAGPGADGLPGGGAGPGSVENGPQR